MSYKLFKKSNMCRHQCFDSNPTRDEYEDVWPRWNKFTDGLFKMIKGFQQQGYFCGPIKLTPQLEISFGASVVLKY